VESCQYYSGKRLSEIQTKLCLAWFIARDTVPHTTAHRYSTGQLETTVNNFSALINGVPLNILKGYRRANNLPLW
jgi:hypothetical protein